MKNLYCFLVRCLILFTTTQSIQAATGSLDPYLASPYLTSSTTPTLSVRFGYVPPEMAADYPRLRHGFGKLYSTRNPSMINIVALDDAYPSGLNSGYIGTIRDDSGEFYATPRGDIGIRIITDCDTPNIAMRNVSGANFPLMLTANSFNRCGGFLPPAYDSALFSVIYYAPATFAIADGNQIESVRIAVKADGIPWANYVFGYRIGLIEFAIDPSKAANFQVPGMSAITLPPPAVEGIVVEYVDSQDFALAPGGHYFYSSEPDEQAFVDGGGAGHFQRTGRIFKAGGYVPVCRFYGSVSPGPNSHFFSADQNECAGLKAQEKSPVPADVPQWNSEGKGFYAVAAVTAANGTRSCLTGTVPVYRAYNNAYKNGKRNNWDSNHRFSVNHADIDQLVTGHDWSDEGIAFCAPG